MARIAGIDLPNKPLKIALTYIYGIGNTSASNICKIAEIDETKRAKDLTNEEVSKLRNIIENDYVVEGRLRTVVAMNIRRLMEIACYRGLRHRKGLPVRGQRTRTNARTRKGKKKTIAGKKIAKK